MPESIDFIPKKAMECQLTCQHHRMLDFEELCEGSSENGFGGRHCEVKNERVGMSC
jgi:hypothetical protein